MEAVFYEALRAAIVAGICYCLYPPNITKAARAIRGHFDRLDELEERIETHIINGHKPEEIT